jgi:hypothetical protein
MIGWSFSAGAMRSCSSQNGDLVAVARIEGGEGRVRVHETVRQRGERSPASLGPISNLDALEQAVREFVERQMSAVELA